MADSCQELACVLQQFIVEPDPWGSRAPRVRIPRPRMFILLFLGIVAVRTRLTTGFRKNRYCRTVLPLYVSVHNFEPAERFARSIQPGNFQGLGRHADPCQVALLLVDFFNFFSCSFSCCPLPDVSFLLSSFCLVYQPNIGLPANSNLVLLGLGLCPERMLVVVVGCLFFFPFGVSVC